MDEDNSKDKNKESVMKFALLIQKNKNAQGIETRIESQNQGIANSEVLLTIEAWLEKAKENFKNPIKEGLFFR